MPLPPVNVTNFVACSLEPDLRPDMPHFQIEPKLCQHLGSGSGQPVICEQNHWLDPKHLLPGNSQRMRLPDLPNNNALAGSKVAVMV